jgi:hypothetical protein
LTFTRAAEIKGTRRSTQSVLSFGVPHALKAAGRFFPSFFFASPIGLLKNSVRSSRGQPFGCVCSLSLSNENHFQSGYY